MDWIGNRVQPRCAAWVETVEAQLASGKTDGLWRDRTPWWEEVKRCVESDHVPNRSEGWNHPVASSYLSSGEPQSLSSMFVFNSNICSVDYCCEPPTSIAGIAFTSHRISSLGGYCLPPLFSHCPSVRLTVVRSDVGTCCHIVTFNLISFRPPERNHFSMQ